MGIIFCKEKLNFIYTSQSAKLKDTQCKAEEIPRGVQPMFIVGVTLDLMSQNTSKRQQQISSENLFQVEKDGVQEIILLSQAKQFFAQVQEMFSNKSIPLPKVMARDRKTEDHVHTNCLDFVRLICFPIMWVFSIVRTNC